MVPKNGSISPNPNFNSFKRTLNSNPLIVNIRTGLRV